jgi:ubiquinone/menaquinone biosynthesis C-methylase UbiE
MYHRCGSLNCSAAQLFARAEFGDKPLASTAAMRRARAGPGLAVAVTSVGFGRVAQLRFDEGMVDFLEVVNHRRDIVRRRHLVHAALGAQPGERVLDVGCGPGFFVAELLDAVGTEGRVTGVDMEPTMLAVAAKRTEGRDNVAFYEAQATSLPLPDGIFDAAVSVQVLEYVQDVSAALAEIHRTLRPCGRVVVWDIDWATVSWHTVDHGRMRRMLDAWDRHLTHPSLPQTLAPLLRDAGFADVTMHGHTFATNALDPETHGGAIVPLVVQYAVEQGGMDSAEAAAWKAEQDQLAAHGKFYFACIQLCFGARKPG